MAPPAHAGAGVCRPTANDTRCRHAASPSQTSTAGPNAPPPACGDVAGSGLIRVKHLATAGVVKQQAPGDLHQQLRSFGAAARLMRPCRSIAPMVSPLPQAGVPRWTCRTMAKRCGSSSNATTSSPARTQAGDVCRRDHPRVGASWGVELWSSDRICAAGD